MLKTTLLCHSPLAREGGRPLVLVMALIVCALTSVALAQKPQAILPRLHINTAWNPPTGGTTWAAHTPAQLTSALNAAAPGDIIVLDAGRTYVGNFYLTAKSNPNNKWIYIMSSAIAKLAAGHRVAPADAVHMPRIVTTNVIAAFQVNGGANHYRLAGLEMTTASTYCQTGRNCMTYFLVGSQSYPTPLPDSIVIDRCFIHGNPKHDLQSGVTGNATNFAVVDSYLSAIHSKGLDSQAFAAYDTPGPIKLVNNYLSAAGENIMFGGAGGNGNRGVPSDIEIRRNHLLKPLSWLPLSLSGKMVVKNAFECKSCQRVLFDSNTITNVWANGQNGFAIVLTVRTSQSGDSAVVNDITITNNILNNVAGGFNSLAADDQCGSSSYPNCKNAGSQDRWYIANNQITFYDPALPGGYKNSMLALMPGWNNMANVQGQMRNVVFQHNTGIPPASTPCWDSTYFSAGAQTPPLNNLTNNIWLLDNVFCRQPFGDWGLQGTSGLTQYMGYPSTPPYDLTQRFYGNVMYAAPGDKVQSYPPHNYATPVPFTYVNPLFDDFQLLTPYWTDTSDGKLTGVDYSLLP